MKSTKFFARVLAVLLALVLIIGVFATAMFGVNAVTQDEIDELEKEQEELEEKQAEVADQISSLEYEQSTTLAKKSVLDEQIYLTEQEIANTEKQIQEYDVLIAEKGVEVEAAQARQDEQWELYKYRIRALEENGTISYILILFQARSFSDLLARLDYISAIMKYDAQLYEQYNQSRLDTIAAKEELERLQTSQEAKKVELEADKAELEVKQAQSVELLMKIQEDMEALEELRAEYEAELDKLDSEIQELIEELERQQMSGNGSSVVGTGSFCWPSDSSYYVTSLFGGRIHPILGYWKSHTGIDIGAYYGSNVLAADSGTVAFAGWNGGYGNCVIIDHGNGYMTLYGHMSALAVYEGETVYRGDTIAYVGSTGMSTGPHLHFEMYYYGERIDPLAYYSGYTVDPYA